MATSTITKRKLLDVGKAPIGVGGGSRPPTRIKHFERTYIKKSTSPKKSKRTKRESVSPLKREKTLKEIEKNPVAFMQKRLKESQIKPKKKIDLSTKLINPRTGKLISKKEFKLQTKRQRQKDFFKSRQQTQKEISKRAKIQKAIKAPIAKPKNIVKATAVSTAVASSLMKSKDSLKNYAMAQQIATTQNMPFEKKQTAIKKILSTKEQNIIKADPLINPFLMKPVTKGAMQVKPVTKAVPKPKEITETAPATKLKTKDVPKPKEITITAPATKLKTKAVPKPKEITKTAPVTKAVPKQKEITETPPAEQARKKDVPKPKEITKTAPATLPTTATKTAQASKKTIIKTKKKLDIDLSKGSYIRRVNWRQGLSNRSLDLVTGKTRTGSSLRVGFGVTPQQTLIVSKVSTRIPKIKSFKMGNQQVTVKRKSLKFRSLRAS